MKSYETPIFHRFSLAEPGETGPWLPTRSWLVLTDADCCEDGRGTQLLIG